MPSKNIEVDDYGDVLAVYYDLEKVIYKETGSYQGSYIAVLRDETRYFLFSGEYGSCTGCDWLEDNSIDIKFPKGTTDKAEYTVKYTDIKKYSLQKKPKYILPAGGEFKDLLKITLKELLNGDTD